MTSDATRWFASCVSRAAPAIVNRTPRCSRPEASSVADFTPLLDVVGPRCVVFITEVFYRPLVGWKAAPSTARCVTRTPDCKSTSILSTERVDNFGPALSIGTVDYSSGRPTAESVMGLFKTVALRARKPDTGRSGRRLPSQISARRGRNQSNRASIRPG
jgi:hypothetical protein